MATQDLTVRDRIRQVLQEKGRLGTKDIATELQGSGVAYQTVRQELSNMAREGTVIRPHTGVYELPEGPMPADSTRALKESPPALKGAQEAEARETDLVYIPLASVRANGGQGELPVSTEIEAYLALDRAAVRRELAVNPDRLVMVPVSGDSMRPTLYPGDRVLVHLLDAFHIVDGSIYVFARRDYGVVIKRAYWQQDGSVLLRGDNRRRPNELRVTPQDAHEWKLVGKVVRVEKNL